MSNIEVLSRTQHLHVDGLPVVEVRQTTQKLIIDNKRGITIVRGGPPGPPGLKGEKGDDGDPAAVEAEVAARIAADEDLYARKVELLGDTMQGPLILHSLDPSNSLEAVPKAYVDAAVLDVTGAISDNYFTREQSNERFALITSLDAEILARTTAVANLATNLGLEQAARIAADDQFSDDLSAEITARTSAITTLTTNLSSEQAARISADDAFALGLSGEISARTSAVNTLTTNLSSEVSARIAAVSGVSSDLSAEVTARIAQGTTLTTNLSAETSARIAGDAALQTSIDGLTTSLASSYMTLGTAQTVTGAKTFRAFSIDDGTNGMLSFTNSSGENSINSGNSGFGSWKSLQLRGANVRLTDSGNVDRLQISHASGSVVAFPGAAGNVGLVVRGHTAQTANLQEWQNSSGTVVASVLSSGAIRAAGTVTEIAAGVDRIDLGVAAGTPRMVFEDAGSTIWQIDNSGGTFRWFVPGTVRMQLSSAGRLGLGGSSLGMAHITNTDATNLPVLIVQGMASQTADLQQYRDSAGTVVSRITSAGSFFYGASGTNGWAPGTGDASTVATSAGLYLGDLFVQPEGITKYSTNNDLVLQAFGSTTTQLRMRSAVGTAPNKSVHVLGRDAAIPHLIVQGAASQTADLQQWRDSAGTVLVTVGPSGSMTMNATGSTTTAPRTFGFTGLNAGGNTYRMGSRNDTTGLWYDGFQAGNGMKMQLISYYGMEIAGGTAQDMQTMGFATGDATTAPALLVNNRTASRPALAVRGGPSQTADLTQWQNSAGTILAALQAGGSLVTTAALSAITGLFNTGASASPGLQIATTGDTVGRFTAYNNGVLGFGAGGSTAQDTFLNRLGSGGLIAQGPAAQPIFIVKGAASQTGSLQEWQVSGGTVVASIGSTGVINASTGINSSGILQNNMVGSGVAYAAFASLLPGFPALVLRGAASQTADIFRVQNNAGTTLASIASTGSFVTSGDIAARYSLTGQTAIGGYGPSGESALLLGSDVTMYRVSPNLLYMNDQFVIQAPLSSVPALVARGAAGQTNDVFQVQNSSSTPILQIGATGHVSTGKGITIGTDGNSGIGGLYMREQTVNPINAAGYTVLYPDVSGGLQRVMVRWGSGATQVIATEGILAGTGTGGSDKSMLLGGM